MKERGFTLVELAVVALVLALLAAATIALIDAGPDRQASVAAEGASADLLYARALAIRTGQTVIVGFTPGSSIYQLQSSGALLVDPRTGRSYLVDLRSSAGSGQAVVVSSNFGGSPAVFFAPDGSPTAGGQVVIGVGPAQWAVTVTPVTGRVMYARVGT